jgi:hypothetical protein
LLLIVTAFVEAIHNITGLLIFRNRSKEYFWVSFKMMVASDILSRAISTDLINTEEDNVLDTLNGTLESVEEEENMFQYISRMNKKVD